MRSEPDNRIPLRRRKPGLCLPRFYFRKWRAEEQTFHSKILALLNAAVTLYVLARGIGGIMQKSKYLILTTVLSASAATAALPAMAAPQLIGDKAATRPVCGQALAIAQAAYDAPVFYLSDIRGVPKGLGSTLILQPRPDIDLSGGNAVVADPAAFQAFLKPTSQARTYWQTKPVKDTRLVLDGDRVGWRGDMHSLYALPAMTSLNDFRAHPGAFRALIVDTWKVPWVLKRAKTGEVWVIDTGDGGYLADWTIFIQGSETPACTIRFVNYRRDALRLVPPEVRELAGMLDDTLGPGLDEGTLQPTARIRVKAQQAWANVALRPWALSREPYNSRQQVDDALKAWAKTSPRAKRLHARIYRQYPVAKAALTQLYMTRFGKTEAGAQTMAEASLDIALRSYFKFPRESAPQW